MKLLKNVALVAVIGCVLSCTTKKSEDAVASSCSFANAGLSRISSFGTFVPATFDQCEQFNGATSLWSGMDVGASSTAMIALPSALFNSGAACGSCWRIEGASATMVARVITECPSCASDVIDMDEDSFNLISGQSSGVGYASVTATAIPCPSTENVKIWMNDGTNPFYLNIAVANHATPLKKVEVDSGTGYQELPRVGSTGAFALAPGYMVSATAQVRVTDMFDQTVSGTFATAVSSSTTLDSQFGTCGN